MKIITPMPRSLLMRWMTTAALSVALLLGASIMANADEADAKRIFKAMSDYMASQKAISFAFDATLEIVTIDEQKLGLASSGSLVLNRPDKIHVARTGGFTDVEMFFDGKTMTLLGKNLNVYTQVDIPGNIDHLVNELKDTYGRPLPAADLMLSHPYDEMMGEVVDVKDLGSGVVGGIVCDHLAFRTADVDWQIWIAQGDAPYPCRYVITSKGIQGGPQYTVQLRDWQAGDGVAATDFRFKNTTTADKVELTELKGAEELPEHFRLGGTE